MSLHSIVYQLVSKISKEDKNLAISDPTLRIGFELEFLVPYTLSWNNLMDVYEEELNFSSAHAKMAFSNLDSKHKALLSWIPKSIQQSLLIVPDITASKPLQKQGYSVIVPDSSVSENGDDWELVVQPAPIKLALEELKPMLEGIGSAPFKTDNNCSIHIGISFKGLNLTENLDPVKLILFLEEDKIFSKMPSRKDNGYAQKLNNSPILTSTITKAVKDLKIKPEDFDSKVDKLIQNFKTNSNKRSKIIEQLANKYQSVNLTKLTDNYLEFRLLGGADYPKQYSFIKSVILDFSYVIKLACTEDRQEEYHKKLKRYLTKVYK